MATVIGQDQVQRRRRRPARKHHDDRLGAVGDRGERVEGERGEPLDRAEALRPVSWARRGRPIRTCQVDEGVPVDRPSGHSTGDGRDGRLHSQPTRARSGGLSAIRVPRRRSPCRTADPRVQWLDSPVSGRRTHWIAGRRWWSLSSIGGATVEVGHARPGSGGRRRRSRSRGVDRELGAGRDGDLRRARGRRDVVLDVVVLGS